MACVLMISLIYFTFVTRVNEHINENRMGSQVIVKPGGWDGSINQPLSIEDNRCILVIELWRLKQGF